MPIVMALGALEFSIEVKPACGSVFAAAIPSQSIAFRLLLCRILQLKLSQESPSVPQLTSGQPGTGPNDLVFPSLSSPPLANNLFDLPLL